MAYKLKLLIIFLIIGIYSKAQNQSIFQNHSYKPYDRYVYNSENRFHTSIQPYNLAEVNTIISIDTLFKVPLKNKYLNHLYNNDLIQIKDSIFSITINPSVDFELSQQQNDTTFGWINNRGVYVDASLTEKVHIFTSFNEIQSRYFDYRYDRINELGSGTVPGISRGKAFGSDSKGLDYAYANAYISYNPNSIFNFQVGHGKHFIGDGYRSLLLSDNAMNYPYAKFTTDFWNIKYIQMWSQQYNVEANHIANTRYPKKWNVMHYIDWSVTNWLNIGIFETVIWEDEDSLGNHRGFEFNYVNPVIFMRPVEFSIGSPDNVMMGLTGKLSLWKNHIFYGQLALDEFNIAKIKEKNGWYGNKYAIQAGYKTFDIAKIKNLDFQTEINYVRPFIYSHFKYGQNYGHALQSMAHPRGSNFYENITFVRYSINRIFFEAKLLYLVHGIDTANSNYGNNIFKLYPSKTTEDGNITAASAYKNTVVYRDFKISYLLNPHSNMNISIGVSHRTQNSEILSNSKYLYYIGFKTNLENFYYDF